MSVGAHGRRASAAAGGASPPGDVSASLPHDVTSAGAARRLVADALDSWGLSRLRWTAGLAVTELVTNALLHGRPPVTVAVRRLPGSGVRVEVGDGSPRLPVVRRHAETAVTGRGLRLLAETCARTGVELTEAGKVVWADVVDG